MALTNSSRSINLCPEPCGKGQGSWGRWLNIPAGEIAPIDVSDQSVSLYATSIDTNIQSSGGQYTLRGNFTLTDNIGAGAGIDITFDFGGTSYVSNIDIQAGESSNLVEFELVVDDLSTSARLSRLILWVRGRTGGSEPVEISMPSLPLGSVPQADPSYILDISGICTTGDCIFTWTSIIGENFKILG